MSLNLLSDVFRRRYVVHGRMRIDAEDVVARLFLKDARRAANVEHGKLFQFFGHRRDREAISRRHVADHHVDVIALHEIAELGDHVRGGAGLVEEFGLDLGAAESDLVIGRRDLAGVELIDQEFGGVVIGYAERGGGRSGEESHKADLDRRRLLGPRAARRRKQKSERPTGCEDNRCAVRMLAPVMLHVTRSPKS